MFADLFDVCVVSKPIGTETHGRVIASCGVLFFCAGAEAASRLSWSKAVVLSGKCGILSNLDLKMEQCFDLRMGQVFAVAVSACHAAEFASRVLADDGAFAQCPVKFLADGCFRKTGQEGNWCSGHPWRWCNVGSWRGPSAISAGRLRVLLHPWS